MGENSKIAWTNHTFNPWWGCTQVSPGCGLPVKGEEDKPHGTCYAKVLAERFGYSEGGSKFPIWGQDAGRRSSSEKYWNEPLTWNKMARINGIRAKVFCGSMCDVMEDREELELPRRRLYRTILNTQYLNWLLLTKRPQNFRKLLPDTWLWKDEMPPNVWGMTTVENQDYAWRVKELQGVPFTVRGLSCEPLLGPIRFPSLEGINWIIAGAESGSNARPMNHDWVRLLRDQCVAEGIALFYKQDAWRGRVIHLPELDGKAWTQFPDQRQFFVEV